MRNLEKLEVGIIDFGISNITSVTNAFQKIGFTCHLINEENHDFAADVLVLPGVGNFGYLAAQLKVSKLKERILSHYNKGLPIIGICLGMQILFERSDESPSSKGLGLISGEVRKLISEESEIVRRSVPNIGYNLVNTLAEKPISFTLNTDSLSGYYYFLHSYAVFDCLEDTELQGFTEFSDKQFVSFFLRKNLCGIQFHPERSGEKGLYFFRSNHGTLRAKSCRICVV